MATSVQTPDLKHLGIIVQHLAIAGNDLGTSGRSISEQEQKRIDAEFKSIFDSAQTTRINMLPDEISREAVSASGSSLHSIGVLLEHGTRNAYSPAVLARNVIENAAAASFICPPGISNDERTVRGINVGVRYLLDTGAQNPNHPLHHDYQSLRHASSRFSQIKGMKVPAYPKNFEDRVKEGLNEVEGNETYKALHSYSHANITSQLRSSLRDGADDTVDLLLATGAIFSYTINRVSTYRSKSPDRFHELHHYFSSEVLRLQQVFADESRYPDLRSDGTE